LPTRKIGDVQPLRICRDPEHDPRGLRPVATVAGQFVVDREALRKSPRARLLAQAAQREARQRSRRAKGEAARDGEQSP
jgi:hypothetical protein